MDISPQQLVEIILVVWIIGVLACAVGLLPGRKTHPRPNRRKEPKP